MLSWAGLTQLTSSVQQHTDLSVLGAAQHGVTVTFLTGHDMFINST